MKEREELGSTQGSTEIEVGVFDQAAPLVGYSQMNAPAILKLYSLREDKTKHILRFGSQIIKFQTSSTQ